MKKGAKLSRLRSVALLLMVIGLFGFGVEPGEGAVACGPSTQSAPRAVDDVIDWPSGPILIPVLQNDYDPDGTPLVIVSVGSAAPAGQVAITADKKSLSFTPSAGYSDATFAYTIQDAAGETATATVYIRPSGPTVSFTYTCNNGTDCSFTANPSTFENLTEYRWRFLCPAGASGCTPQTVQGRQWRSRFQQLIAPGDWTVALDVTYYTGKVASTQQKVTIESVTPWVRFVEAFEDGAKDDMYLGIEITETNFQNPNEAEYRIYWDLLGAPDSYVQLSHLSSPLHYREFHSYSAPGVRRVRVWVKNLQGIVGTYERDFDLRNGPPEILEFTLASDPVNPHIVVPTIRTFDDANRIVSYQHDYGSGHTVTYNTNNVDPFIVPTPGDYTMTLRVTDNFGATATASRDFTVPNTAPQLKRVAAKCKGLKCTFTAVEAGDDLGIRSYTWAVNGQTITTDSPTYTHTFPTPGRYPMVLTLSDGELTTESRRVVEVRNEQPAVSLGFFTITPCRAYDSGTNGLTSGVTKSISLAACIPPAAVAAEVNATVVLPTQEGQLALWAPSDAAWATTALNFKPGVTRANSAAVRVSGQAISAQLATTPASAARLIIDVVGYYADDAVAPRPSEVGPLHLEAADQTVLYDSRQTGGVKLTTAASAADLAISSAQRAVFAHATVINSSAPGHLRSYAAGTAAPVSSMLNFPAAAVVENTFVSQVSSAGKFTLGYYPSSSPASTDYLVQVLGKFWTPLPTYRWLSYQALQPCRMLDTRNAEYGQTRLPANTNTEIALDHCGLRNLPRDVFRVNITVVNPQAAGQLSVRHYNEYGPTPLPVLSYAATGATSLSTLVANDLSNDFFYLNPTTATDVIIDVVGYYRSFPWLNVTTSGLTAKFDVLANGGQVYQWNYGDGTQSAVVSTPICKTYDLPGTYAAQGAHWMPGIDPDAKDPLNRSVTVTNAIPVAQFTTAQNRKDLSFDASGSSDEPPPQDVPVPASGDCNSLRTNTELRFEWAFGDGATGSGITASHKYVAPGTYTAQLTAIDRAGARGVTQKSIVIPNDPPTAAFVFDCSGLGCQFNAGESTDDGKITAYNWNFGSGPSSTTAAATSYTFPKSGRYVVTLTTSDGSLSSPVASAVVNVTSAAPTAALSFFPISPCRILDSRSGAKLSGGVATQIQVTSAGGATAVPCGIPATAVAIAADFVAFDPTADGSLTAWDGSGAAPSTSVLDFSLANAPRAGNSIVNVGSTGKISVLPKITGAAPATHLLLDVYGYFAPDTIPAVNARGPYRYDAMNLCRLYDSRSGSPLSANEIRYVKLDPLCGVPAAGSAIASNLLILNSTAGGNATLFSSALGAPAVASTLNYRPAINVANGALVELGKRTTDDLGIKYVPTSSSSTAHVIVDGTGYFSSSGALSYRAVAPCRLLDTRLPEYGLGRLTKGVTSSLQVQGNCGIPRGAAAAVLNVVALAPDGGGNLQMGRSDKAFGATSVLNFVSGDVAVSNGVIIGLAPSLSRDLAILPNMFAGTGLHLAVDVVGYFAPNSGAAQVTQEDSK